MWPGKPIPECQPDSLRQCRSAWRYIVVFECFRPHADYSIFLTSEAAKLIDTILEPTLCQAEAGGCYQGR